MKENWLQVYVLYLVKDYLLMYVLLVPLRNSKVLLLRYLPYQHCATARRRNNVARKATRVILHFRACGSSVKCARLCGFPDWERHPPNPSTAQDFLLPP